MIQLALAFGRALLVRGAKPAIQWGWNSKAGRNLMRYSVGDIPVVTRGETTFAAFGESGFTIGFWSWWLGDFAGSDTQKRLSANLIYYTSSPIEGGFTLESIVGLAVGEPDWSLLTAWRGFHPSAPVPLPPEPFPVTYSLRNASGQLIAVFTNVRAIDP